MIVDDYLKNADVTFVGSDTLDGLPMRVYQYVLNDAEKKATGKIWIGAKDYLPHKSEGETTIEGRKTKVTVTYYDYNADIRIVPPM